MPVLVQLYRLFLQFPERKLIGSKSLSVTHSRGYTVVDRFYSLSEDVSKILQISATCIVFHGKVTGAKMAIFKILYHT